MKTNKKPIIILQILMIYLMLLTTGCQEKSKEVTQESEHKDTFKPVWYLEPTFSFNEVSPIVNLENQNGYHYDFLPYTFVTIGEQTGLMDFSGNMMIPVEENVEWCTYCGVVSQSELHERYDIEGKNVGPNGHGASFNYYDLQTKKTYCVDLDQILPWEEMDLEDGVEIVEAANIFPDVIVNLRKYLLVDNHGSLISQDEYTSYRKIIGETITLQKDQKWGCLNLDGVELIPFKYDNAYAFSNGIAAVSLDGKWGYINELDEVVIPFIFDETTTVYEGKAWAKFQGKWGVLDMRQYIE